MISSTQCSILFLANSTYKWKTIFTEKDISRKLICLTTFLSSVNNKFALLHTYEAKKKSTPWITTYVEELMTERDNIRRLTKRTKNSSIIQTEFRKFRHLVQTKIRDSYNQYKYNSIKNRSKKENI